MSAVSDVREYIYDDEEHGHHHSYLLPELRKILARFPPSTRIFDLGCGNGSTAASVAAEGFVVEGVDPSDAGVASARNRYPHLNIQQGSAYDDLAAKFGTYPVVISMEVVEHIYAPRDYAKTVFSLLKPGGTAIISTPYHGYAKNLAVALVGGFDRHVSPLWDHGHIKFWSVETLTQLMLETGFIEPRFHFVGRIRPFAKSMIGVFKKPARLGFWQP